MRTAGSGAGAAAPLAETRRATFSYTVPGGSRRGVADVSLTLHPGRVVFVLGPNGSGKSTLFRLLLGLSLPQGGEVLLDGRRTDHLRPREVARLAAYIPQQDEITYSFSVRDTVLMGRTPHLGQLASRPTARDHALADEAIEALGISHLAHHGVRDISGGERQLTMLARALCQQGRLLVLDEPTASLDFANQERVLQEVHRLSRTGLGVLVSSHDPLHALRFADEVVLLHEGRKVWSGPTRDLDEDVLSGVYGIPLTIATAREVPGLRMCVPLPGAMRDARRAPGPRLPDPVPPTKGHA